MIDIRSSSLDRSSSQFATLAQIAANAPGAFHDVTQGKNNGVNGNPRAEGFPAIKGWDAASGMGTPDYAKLSAAALALQ